MIRFLFKKKTSLLPKSYLTFLKTKLGITPKNESYFLEAITHSSYKNISKEKKDNERLEFLGDAFISMVVTDYVFKKYPDQQEGYLTKLRSKIVSREQLNKFGKEIELDKHILYQKGKNSYKSLVGNAFEALFGAILLDKGYELAKDCFEQYILNPYLDIKQILIENRDFKSELLIHYQKLGEKVTYNTTSDPTKKEETYFVSYVMLNEEKIGEGSGPSKKIAEMQASKKVLNELLSS
jgi:ribonuclease-3